MKTVLIKNSDQLSQLSEAWSRLNRLDESDNIFLTHEWLSTWWEYFKQGCRLNAVIVYEEGEVIGIAPLVVQSKFGFRQLRFMSSGIADYEGFVLAGDADKCQRAVECILDALIKNGADWDFFKLTGMRSNCATLSALRAIVARQRNRHFITGRHVDGAPFVAIDKPWEKYVATLRKKFTADTLRCTKLLHQDKAVRFHRGIPQHGVLAPILRQHYALHRKRRTQKRSESLFGDERKQRFFSAVSQRFANRGWLDLSWAEVNEKIGAIHLGFRYRGNFFYYLPTFDHEFQRYGLGRILLFKLLEDAFKEESGKFDFMMGEEAYKKQFNPDIESLYFMAMAAPHRRGKLAFRLFHEWNLKWKALRREKW